MKILYASFGYSTHDYRFLKAFSDAGLNVLFLRFDGMTRQLCKELLPEGVIQVEWLGKREVINDANVEKFENEMRVTLDFFEFDIAVAGPIPNIGYITTKVAKVPVVIISWAFDLLLEIHESTDKLNRARLAIENSAGVIVDCETISKIVTTLSPQDVNLLSIPWGITISDFEVGPRSNRGELFKIISLRPLEKMYDVETLIKSLHLLKNESGDLEFHVKIVGTGSELNRLKQLAYELGVSSNIDWVPPVTEKEVRSLLLDQNLYVSTSLSDGTSISMLQALAIGRQVLVSNLDSNLEWISDGWNGWVFEAGNPTSLAGKIMQIAKSTSTAEVEKRAPLLVREKADWQINQRILIDFLIKTAMS